MLVELATRVHGTSPDWWLDQPFAYALWFYRNLQELDRRQDWVMRMQRIDSANLIALAMHEPHRLAHEHRMAVADAAPTPAWSTEQLRNIGLQIAAEMDRAGVLH